MLPVPPQAPVLGCLQPVPMAEAELYLLCQEDDCGGGFRGKIRDEQAAGAARSVYLACSLFGVVSG